MPSNLKSSIKSAAKFLLDNELIIQTNSLESLKASKEFKKTSLNTKNLHVLYDVAIKNNDFNLMLFDKSIFQFTASNQKLRYCYYPGTKLNIEVNSIDFYEFWLKGEFTLSELEQIYSESEYQLDYPTIRYDYDSNAHCEYYHPCSHLHIGFQSISRIPIKRKLTPFAFVLSILNFYYNDIWKKIEITNGNKFIHDLYILQLSNSNLLTQNEFTLLEERKLYLV